MNLSTRGFSDTGDGVLAAGFVVKGSTPKKVLVRGIGPTLSNYNVPSPMADPTLQVYASGNVMIAQNDNWETGQAVSGQSAPASAADIAAAAKATGAFDLPSGSKDSAVLLTLQPGVYSAVVSGANGTTGVTLVEVYDVP